MYIQELKPYFNVHKRDSGHAVPCSGCQDACSLSCTFRRTWSLRHPPKQKSSLEILDLQKVCFATSLSNVTHSAPAASERELAFCYNQVLLSGAERLPDPTRVASGFLVPRSFPFSFLDDSQTPYAPMERVCERQDAAAAQGACAFNCKRCRTKQAKP